MQPEMSRTSLALEPLADFSDFAVAETHVADCVDALGRVDHASAS